MSRYGRRSTCSYGPRPQPVESPVPVFFLPPPNLLPRVQYASIVAGLGGARFTEAWHVSGGKIHEGRTRG